MLISPLYYIMIRMSKRERFMCRPRRPPPPLRGTSPAAAVGGFVGGKPDICAIHRCPSCKKGFEHS